MATIWCNGQWKASEEGMVSIFDRGLLHGLGLFETILAVDGHPAHMSHHIARFKEHAERLNWANWVTDRHDFHAIAIELLNKCQLTHGRARLRLSMTAGTGGLNDLKPGDGHLLWMTASQVKENMDSSSLALSLWRRNEHSPLAGLKCASYAENLVALDWARRQDHDEVVFLNSCGNLCEAATANLFLVINSSLYTPNLDSGCLAGVTRAWVIGHAKSLGIPVHEESLQLDDLQRANECFLTSAIRGVVPVTRFEDMDFPVGELTTRLMEDWTDSVIPR